MLIRSPFELKDQKLSGTKIECGVDPKHSDFAIRCSFCDCEVIIVKPCDWINFSYCTFENCRVIASKESGLTWYDCRWLHCTFIGDFVGSLGGHGMEGEALPGPLLVDCDFRQTNLELFFLVQADLATIKFPRWPNVTIINPYQYRDELQSITFDDVSVRVWWIGMVSFGRPADAAISSMTFNWHKVVERRKNQEIGGRDLSPHTDVVRSTLAKLPYVVM